MNQQDLVDRLVGIDADDALYTVRHQREKVVAATQGSLEALFDPALPGLSLVERLAVAVHACRLTPSPELADYYQQRLVAEKADPAVLDALAQGAPQAAGVPRLDAMLEFTRKLIQNPVEGDRAALEALPAAGLSTSEVVTLSQLIAFLSYQVRLVAGLKAMKSLEHAA
ncbi:CMD domain protein [Bordetella holmesii]|uniref:CMD domain protein, Avi_7170 family n=2 Tax=Bordetella holmesii TaxID=35814 RepID=A0A158M026_9BORD|nr:CMD domain protein [Bordetella holmesii]AHV94431.1 putative membrane associated protein [Bordetella holmesii ATCC 51541]AIT28476.1 putative membrane associated protein [Bordetella holmesii 44057]EWM41265.1 putative membrane associated protein [Bordetella holmesii 35009]EWM41745.1 putative membrane associated protein [Bordetella holmesii 41130]EWM45157.1 putative membrane associated protein [Bordetella holmesii 70147]